jgi:cbb3-type cytochrome oxidase maturation protein
VSVLFVVVPAALLLVLVAVIAFVWASRSGQFDDLTTPAVRSLHDDSEPEVRPPGKRHRRVPGGPPRAP